jgi:predicted translin family RNA/ssDNA-binding protein
MFIVQRLQHGLGRRQQGDQEDQHFKEEIIRLMEDLSRLCKSTSHKTKAAQVKKT